MLPEIEVTNFELFYDGMYEISWQEIRKLPIYLPFDMLLKMLEIEGFSLEYVADKAQNFEPLIFKKVVLKLQGKLEDGGMCYLPSEHSMFTIGCEISFK